MTLENHMSQINENIFFKEFCFSRNEFSPCQESELEFADHVIWLDDLLITFQLKERALSGAHTRETEITWFKKKVVGKATKQIRDTLHYLNTYEEVNITNEKGHIFNVVSGKISKRIHVVSYAPHDLLPEEYRSKKFHLSSTAGLIHMIPFDDYVGICQTLITPAEIGQYLEFRKDISTKHESKVNALPEQALVGQFLCGDFGADPDIDFVKYLAEFNQVYAEFDFSHILRIFADRIVNASNPHEYYQILKELAKLNRNELKEVKYRFDLCIEKCRKNEFCLPYRVTFPRTGCGFFFIIVRPEHISNTINALQNFTYGHKYDQKLNKCIGTSFSRDGQYFDIGWCYIEEEWTHDREMEQRLKENSPFRPVKAEIKPRYRLGGQMPKQ
jgi:hypothetical protein